jgi:iron complex outermembrane receptor protein
MYWTPGGNPELKNETGTAAELTWDMTSFHNGSFRLKNDITYFRNNISNLIQWRPGSFAYWEAVNLGSVITSGIEAGAVMSCSFGSVLLSLDAGYVHTNARSGGKNAESSSPKQHQLVYVPENQLNFSLRINRKKLFAFFVTDYTGRRYLTADNSGYLPHYTVSCIYLGSRLEGPRHSVDLSLSVDNLFDASWQNIAYYPMPGRNIYLSLSYQYKK